MRTLLVLAIAATLAACGGKTDTAAAPEAKSLLGAPLAGTPVVTVDGDVVTEPLLRAFAEPRRLDLADPTQRQRAIDGLVDSMVLARDALNGTLGASEDVQAKLAHARIETLAAANVAAFRDASPIGDAQLQAFYDEEAARTGGVELQLQHILFGDEASARSAVEIAKQPGADFDELMSGYASTAKQAKQLDWANLAQLPPELAQVAKGLADGQVAEQPVQTQYGWHVVKRVASRPYAVPPIDQVREGARRQLGDQLLRERVKALREKAKIVSPGG